MLKVKAAQKERPKNDAKHSPWSKIPPEVKLDDVNNTEIEKDNKSVKIRTQILFKLSGSMFLSRKNEEETQCPAAA